MSEETKQEAPAEESTPAMNLAALLSRFDGAPDSDMIEKWKQQHGEVFCSGFSDEELFVWRPLTRREYVALQKLLRQPVQDPSQAPTEYDFEEQVVQTCVLWSSKGNVLDQKGGSVSTLSEQIMMNSNFMAPAMAATLVIKL